MTRKNNTFSNQSAPGGFVPASTQGSRHSGSNSMEFNAPVEPGQGTFVQYSRNTANYSNRKRPGMSHGAKIGIAVLIIALVAGVAGLGFYVYKEMQKQTINEDLHNNMTKAEMQAVDNELTGMTKFDEPFTMLLLGSDAREDDPDMGARTDTIMLVRVDPTQNIISMVSIPRDTMIQVPGAGTQKFNAAYTYGGPSGTIAAVKELCGVDIDHYAEINFEGLVGLVDSIGGIDVYNEEDIDDPDAGDIFIPAGEVHLDGAAALVFSRTRQYEDGDFTRVSNQRKVIEAIVHKGLEAPASELYGLVKASTAFLTTDSGMDVDFIYSLADQIRHNNDYPVTLYTGTIPASTDMVDGVSYVVADPNGVAEMMEVFMAGGDISGTGGIIMEEASSSSSSSSSSESSSSSSSSSAS